MRFSNNRKLNNSVLLNKVDGNYYKVVEEEMGKKLIACRLEGDEVTEDKVTITEKNLICFRLLDNPNPEETPEGYEVSEGILYYENEPATQQGDIYVEEIMGYVPGAVILAVRGREDQEKVNLFSYEPGEDKFRRLIRAELPSNLVAVELKDGLLGIVYSATEDVEKEDADGNKQTVTMFVEAGVLSVSKREALGQRINRPVNLEMIEIDRTSLIALSSAQDVNEDGEVIPSELTYLIYDVESYMNCYDEVVVGEPADITRCAIGGLTFKGEQTFIYRDIKVKNPILTKLADYPVLVDVTTTGNETRVVFSDAEYNVCTLVRTSTPDRGYIYNVE